MNTQNEQAGLDPRDHLRSNERYWSASRIALGAVVLAMVLMWGWIYIFSSRENPDRFQDRAFPEAAEPICAAAKAGIDALPNSRDAATPLERAGQVRAGTEITAAMIDDLRAAATTVKDPEESQILIAWFEDWDAYVDDRWRHVARLESADENTSNRDLAFILSERAAGGIYTRRIDGLANVNDMTSCLVPGDV